MLIESIAIGLVFGLFFYEWIGFSAGGLSFRATLLYTGTAHG